MPWNPNTYQKFKQQRAEPFNDLLELINIRSGLKVIDLGCGTGELTAQLADILPNSQMIGIDSSTEMLEKASKLTKVNLRFELEKIEAISGLWDMIFSNAALHWVDDHYTLIPKLMSMLNPGGQLVVQVPSNHRNRAQETIKEVAAEEPFHKAMGSWKWEFPVLPIDVYAEIIYLNGGQDIEISDKVYPHILDNADEVYEWVSGTTIIPYIERLPEYLHEMFKNECRMRIRAIWKKGPLIFPFRRILFSALKRF
ncbi:MAG: methyltransferase domain-containing protein [Candidatus Hatepunaea meridiana]|nr:methyltransferase domain-containing protein [Candidatus Hatepunaea meridiana]